MCAGLRHATQGSYAEASSASSEAATAAPIDARESCARRGTPPVPLVATTAHDASGIHRRGIGEDRLLVGPHDDRGPGEVDQSLLLRVGQPDIDRQERGARVRMGAQDLEPMEARRQRVGDELARARPPVRRAFHVR